MVFMKLEGAGGGGAGAGQDEGPTGSGAGGVRVSSRLPPSGWTVRGCGLEVVRVQCGSVRGCGLGVFGRRSGFENGSLNRDHVRGICRISQRGFRFMQTF